MTILTIIMGFAMAVCVLSVSALVVVGSFLIIKSMIYDLKKDEEDLK